MMNSNTKMTAQELEQMIAQMEKIFTVVRILDKDLLHKMDVEERETRSEGLQMLFVLGKRKEL